MSAKKALEKTQQPRLLNLHVYVPFYITRIANRWTATASRHYLHQFEVGVAEWGVLAGLSTYGEATSLEISNRIEMDSGAVSRAVNRLLKGGLIVTKKGRFKGRSKPVLLTAAGTRLVEQIQEHALAQEQRLLSPLTRDERKTFLQLLQKVHRSLELLAPT